jgi:O-antigen/teichoic acid export membrane protein
MTSDNSHKQVFVGGSWLIGARAFDRLIGIISISILARLLRPADFGLVAIAGTVVSAIELFSAFGFDWALVRLKEPTVEDLNSAWTLRVLFGIFTFAVLALLGPLAATFYHQPALRAVLLAMGGTSFVGSLENIGTVFFRREFAFHKEFLIRSVSKVVGFCVTLAVAVQYRSYWALVVGVLSLRCVTVLASYLFHPFRPKPSLKNARQLFGFSSWLLFGNIIEYCREKFADLYLGRVFGTRATGLFAVAGEISIVPITEVASPINRAAYSKYAEDVRENRALGPSYISIASLIWMISLPMAAGTVAVAPEVIALLLGPQWHEAQPVLRWLAVGTAFTVMTSNTHYVYWALGHSRVVAGLSMVGAAVIVPVTIVCSHFAGYTGVAFAFALASALVVPINFAVLRRLAGIRFSDLWNRVWRIALGATVMGLTLWLGFERVSFDSAKAASLILIAKIATGAATYLVVVWAAWVVSGKPVGPEHAAVEVVQGAARRFRDQLL